MSAASGLLVPPALQRHTARQRRLYVRPAPASPPDTVTAYQYRVVVVAVRPRARQGQPLGGEAVRGMLGGAGGCVAVLIFTLTYHLGHDGVEGDLLSCCRCTP